MPSTWTGSPIRLPPALREWEQVELSLAALELCDAAYTSAREGRAVRLGDGNGLRAPTAPEPGNWDPGRPYSGTGGGRDGRRLG